MNSTEPLSAGAPRPKVVLVVGSGAREHALARALASEACEVVCAPGNPGTARVARNVDVRVDDVAGLVDHAARERADLVVVGPELPLTLGLCDALAARGIPAFGPSLSAARLEASKAFMKRFLKREGIPTAEFEVFDDPERAAAYVRARPLPLVVKADGLAAGKGVVVASTQEEALEAIDAMMRRRVFGDAGAVVVIESFLPGEEASFHVLCDGETGIPLAAAQDHKRVGDGDAGPNTGGMGAYAPAPIVTADVAERVVREVVRPTLAGMAREGAPFRGVLFIGLMIEAGIPRVLEFNVRFGDPEAGVLLALHRDVPGGWSELLSRAARGDLAGVTLPPVSGAVLSVVMAAEGYPASPRVGDRIEGAEAPDADEVHVLHAGTKRDPSGGLVTAGGRVLNVVARAETLEGAARAAYARADAIRWPGEHHRRDIGARALSQKSTRDRRLL